MARLSSSSSSSRPVSSSASSGREHRHHDAGDNGPAGEKASAEPGTDGGAPETSGEGKGSGSKAKTVWIEKDGLAVTVRVRLGLSDGSYTEVTSKNLHDGDLVIDDAVASGKSTAPGGSASRRIFF